MRGKIVDERDERTNEERTPELSDRDGKPAQNIGESFDLIHDPDENEDEINNQSLEEKTAKPNIATFRGIPKKLHEAIKQTASDLGVSPGELARYLLEVGLTRIEAGEDVVSQNRSGWIHAVPRRRAKNTQTKRQEKSKACSNHLVLWCAPRSSKNHFGKEAVTLEWPRGDGSLFIWSGLERYQKGSWLLTEPIRQIATLYPGDLGEV